MKRIVLALSFLLFSSMSLKAQDTFFNDSLRRHLKHYLVDKGAIEGNREQYSPFNLIIFNEINNQNVDRPCESRVYEYGIYSFKGIETPNYYDILIRRGNEYEILGVLNDRSLMETMTKLIAYFYRYPEVPKELFPLYVDAVSNVYNRNSHWEGAFNMKKKRGISEYGSYSDKDTIYRIIEDSGGQLEFHID